MYRFTEIKELHIELSSFCQASCPMCARNYHGGLKNPLIKKSNINLMFFQKSFTTDFIKNLHSIIICGNFGDPIFNKDLIPIIKYASSINPDILIDLHTNGSAKPASWWKELAGAMPKNHKVHFALDGLEDTHSIYRIGTDFNKIIKNVKSFIAANGKAQWVFITFKHNEHQLNHARQMSRDLGFESFQEKQTSRFIGNPWFEVYDQNGNIAYKLESPTDTTVSFIHEDTVKQYQKLVNDVSIECHIEKVKSIYVDASGHVWPCCFTGAVSQIYSPKTHLTHDFVKDSKSSMHKVIEKLGGQNNINLANRSLENIVDSKEWQFVWNDSFIGVDKLHVCARTCGKFKENLVSQSKDQFLKLDKFTK